MPQHIPDALFATMPPIMQAPIDAGSGPILRPYGASAAFASAPMTPGSRTIRSPPSFTSRRCHPPARTSRIESVTACPERLVPAARNVTGRLRRSATASRRMTSVSLRTFTTILGTSR